MFSLKEIFMFKQDITMVMKKIVLAISLFSCPALYAADAPSIGGSASISADVQGAIINAGAGASGFQGTVKQAVASVLSGSIEGALQTNVQVKGALINVGAGASGAKITACQSIGTVGSDCGSGD
ncbi:hypothetical protein TDB9533_03923 [Thalassocella blandensis]|nr:hypothetical protein TDB9533_03923 [Thalassocella blandensis]